MTTKHSVMYTAIALQYLSVLPGIAWGRVARTYRNVPTGWLFPATISLIMLSIALFKVRRTRPHGRWCEGIGADDRTLGL